MITASKLQKSGFIPGEWVDLDPGDKYRTWRLEISTKTAIEVDEVVIGGATHFEDLSLMVGKACHLLRLTTVTQILELKKLLE